MNALFSNYKRAPVAFRHGHGCQLWDTDGKAYLDFMGGIAVSSLGHAHPRLVQALAEQAGRYIHVSNLFRIPEQEKAGERLTQLSGLDRAFFCNSGTEANEAMIKMARRFAHESGLPPRLVVAHNSFHGRTMGALSATGNPKYHEGFGPMLEGFVFVDFNHLEQALAALDGSCGVLLEPVQGEGGIFPGRADYFQGLQRACREQGKLLLLDEVQTGIGRTGHWFAYQGLGLDPDAVALAKGLGGGMPVGAVLAKQALADRIVPGSHGTTFGGNPLAMAAVLAVLASIEEEALLENVRTLQLPLEGLPGVKEVRRAGLLVGVDLTVSAEEVARLCLERGLLVNNVRPQTLRLAPPLIVGQAEVNQAIHILREVLCQLTASEPAVSA